MPRKMLRCTTNQASNMLLNYDAQYLPFKPAQTWCGTFPASDPKASIFSEAESRFSEDSSVVHIPTLVRLEEVGMNSAEFASTFNSVGFAHFNTDYDRGACIVGVRWDDHRHRFAKSVNTMIFGVVTPSMRVPRTPLNITYSI